MVTADAWGIAAAILMWGAGFTAILVTTAPEEARSLRRWPARPRRHVHPGRSVADLAGSDGDVVDSRRIQGAPASPNRRDPLDQRQRVGPESDRPTDPSDAIDPLAQQAATLLAKAMVASPDRDLLWRRFHELVDATAAELEEAPVREAIEEFERRGLSLDVVARVVQQRLSE
jgi:hypothetical protein